MPCYHPMAAVRMDGGLVKFISKAAPGVHSDITLPCGQCFGCRLERSRQWAMRCLHESSLYENNCFITLTYDDEHLPSSKSLDYSHFQKFMKRLRKRFSFTGIRFYMGGEYGEKEARPHYHACLFNFDFPDKVRLRTTPAGCKLFTSKILEELWPFGMSSVGSLTFESAAYVARYCMKKQTGFNADDFYRWVDPDTGEIHNRVPEFSKMSLKPGIGSPWLDKYGHQVYPRDYVVINARKVKPPKYYDRLFEERDSKITGQFQDAAGELHDWFNYTMEDVKHKRYLDGLKCYDDSSPERLAVRETVARAASSIFKREL